MTGDARGRSAGATPSGPAPTRAETAATPEAQTEAQTDDVTWLTTDELAVLAHLSKAATLFFSLPEHHPSDLSEFAHEIHVAQQRIMSRAAVRWRPEYFTPMNQSVDS